MNYFIHKIENRTLFLYSPDCFPIFVWWSKFTSRYLTIKLSITTPNTQPRIRNETGFICRLVGRPVKLVYFGILFYLLSPDDNKTRKLKAFKQNLADVNITKCLLFLYLVDFELLQKCYV